MKVVKIPSTGTLARAVVHFGCTNDPGGWSATRAQIGRGRRDRRAWWCRRCGKRIRQSDRIGLVEVKA